MTLIEFGRLNPTVSYTNIGYEPTKYAFYPSGIFGLGYYRLTKAGRRHPKGYFKTWQQVYREFENKQCIIVP